MNYENINEITQLSKKSNVLFIEDNNEVREQITKLLSNFFPNIITAHDGEQGYNYYEAFKRQNCKNFDILITDLNLPKMDGISLCKRVLKDNPNQIIIVVSAHTESSKLNKLKELGISNFIQKPINYNFFLNTIIQTVNNLKTKAKF
jgi:CheY-like chemotaxis protein